LPPARAATTRIVNDAGYFILIARGQLPMCAQFPLSIDCKRADKEKPIQEAIASQ